MSTGVVSSAIISKYGRIDARFNMFVSEHEAHIEEFEKKYPDARYATRVAQEAPEGLKKMALLNLAAAQKGNATAQSRAAFINQFPYVALAAFRKWANRYRENMEKPAVDAQAILHLAKIAEKEFGEKPEIDIEDAR